MIKIGVCDDNLSLQRKYSDIVGKAAAKNGMDTEILLFDDGKNVLECVGKKENCPEILFLDIIMEEIGGIETAKALRKMKSEIVIIFLTSSEEYVFELMETNPLAYLMKDQVNIENFEEVLLKAKDNIEKRKEAVCQMENKDNLYRFNLQDICFIKQYKNHCYLQHWDGLIIEEDNFDVLDIIEGKDFYQVHPQYFVSLQHIQKIEAKQLVLSDESHNVIPIAENCVKELKLAFMEYMIKQF